MATQDATPPEQTDSGKYVFADLDEIEGVIIEWEDQGARIRDDGTELQGATHIQSPANDVVTVDYFAALSDVFREFALHNDEMLKYATTHIDKFSASRESIAAIEDDIGAQFRFEGGA